MEKHVQNAWCLPQAKKMIRCKMVLMVQWLKLECSNMSQRTILCQLRVGHLTSLEFELPQTSLQDATSGLMGFPSPRRQNWSGVRKHGHMGLCWLLYQLYRIVVWLWRSILPANFCAIDGWIVLSCRARCRVLVNLAIRCGHGLILRCVLSVCMKTPCILRSCGVEAAGGMGLWLDAAMVMDKM